MRKRIAIPVIILLTISVIVASQYPKLSIATGYGAKCLASGIFVAERDPLSVKALDLDYSIVKYTKSTIDYQKQSVTTSFLGLSKQTAVYREGFGCCLTGDLKPEDLQKNSFSLPKAESGSWRQPWPDGDFLKDTIFSEIDKVKLESSIINAFDIPGDMSKRTAAVLVIYKGEIVGEKYWSEKEITAETKLWGWSMNKSIINAMTGVLVKQGKLDINALAPVPEWLNDKRREITINNLMQMSSGLKWEENYGDVSDATVMLYREPDTYKKAISVPFGKTPGSEWKYSSGTSNILSGIVRLVIGDDQQYHLFPYQEIFRKVGMNSIVFETDAAGNFVGSSYSYATARDWARFGLLYYYDGVWKGDTILPKGWVDYTRTVAKASGGKYGAQFWLNQSSELPDAPKDMFSCQGHRGQRVFIIPSRNLVVVRLGFSEKSFDHNRLIKDILMAIKQ
jgi:CubicO group peptidase (beta-lactamase class C family)